MQSYPLLNEDRYYELRRLQADDLWTYANKKEICKKVGFKLSEYIEEPECPEEVFEYYDENGWLD
jgi:hypothetical protein